MAFSEVFCLAVAFAFAFLIPFINPTRPNITGKNMYIYIHRFTNSVAAQIERHLAAHNSLQESQREVHNLARQHPS